MPSQSEDRPSVVLSQVLSPCIPHDAILKVQQTKFCYGALMLFTVDPHHELDISVQYGSQVELADNCPGLSEDDH